MHVLKRVLLIGSLFMGGLLGCFGMSPSGYAAEKLHICAPVSKDSADGKYVQLVFTEVYRRVGLDVEIMYYPPKRCSTKANAGDLDGETERVPDYNKQFTNLIRIEEPVRPFRFVAYAADPSVVLEGKGWESLKGTPYKVEYLRGNVKPHEMLTGLVSPENLSDISTVVQGIKRLGIGRTDIFITFDRWMNWELKAEQFQGYSIKEIGLMEEGLSYTYLHKKHKALVPKVEDALRQMKAEGVMEGYFNQVYAFGNQR